MAIRRQASFSYLDKAESTSVVSFYVAESNLDVENATGIGEVAALQSAVNAMTHASAAQRATSVIRTASVVIPTNDAAYNGNKLTVFMRDAITADKYQVTIPAVNIASYNTLTGTKNVILLVADGGTTQVETLVTAIEATALSKDGNAMVVTKIVKSSSRQGG